MNRKIDSNGYIYYWRKFHCSTSNGPEAIQSISRAHGARAVGKVLQEAEEKVKKTAVGLAPAAVGAC